VNEDVEGGRPLLRGRVFGFPVHIDLSFPIIMAVIGYLMIPAGYRQQDLVIWMALWLVIATASLLLHELGHALAARAAGAHPRITLTGFGGVTSFVPPQPLSRARSLGISLAGPVAGLAVGGLLLAGYTTLGSGLTAGGWPLAALEIGVFTSIVWSVLNLLPVLPLDGGQAMRELLPGDPAQRFRRASAVSVGTAALLAVVALGYLGQPFIAALMAFFALSNVLALRALAKAPEGTGPEAATTPEQAVVALLWQGRFERARQLLATLPPDRPADLLVHGAVLALTGDPVQGRALLDQEVARRAGDRDAVAVLALTLGLLHDWDGLVAVLQGPSGPDLPASVIARTVQEARSVGRDDIAGRLDVLGDRNRGVGGGPGPDGDRT
jgi:Zn-dependent protease